MSNFWKRTITGILFVAIIVGAVLWNSLTFLIVFGLINFFCLNEFYRIFNIPRFNKYLGLLISVICWLVLSLNILGKVDALWAYLSISSIIIAFIGKPKDTMYVVIGLFYITFPVYLLILSAFYTGTYQNSFILALLIFVWVNDTMAYVTGSLFGKHKFFEKISPKKTWEGVAGGIIFTLGFAIVNFYLFKKTTLVNWFIMAFIVSIFAITGDLFESMMKRKLHLKDSGNFFPGHGGFLDRFDALLFVIPFYFLYLVFMVY